MTRRLRDRLIYFTRRQIQPKLWPEFWPACWRGTLWLCLLASSATAQAQYRFDNWTTEHGLPQNSVLAITQTHDGYLWLATYNGLVRFDGMRFTVFDKNNTKAFKTSRCQGLVEDGAGALWISTFEEGGLIRYQNGVFTLFTSAQGLPSDTIINVQVGPDGVPLISTSHGTVWWRNEKFVRYEGDAPNEFSKAYLGRSGTHWFADKDGLHERGKGGRVAHYSLPVEPAVMSFARMYEDRSGGLWIAPQRHGVFKVKDGIVTDYTQRLKLKPATTILPILEDRDGSLWLGTLKSELIHFRDGAAESATVYTTANGLPGNAIRGLCQDREGTLWIGTDGGGLCRLTRQFISGYSEAQGLAGNVAHAVLGDRAGNMWVATQAGLGKIANGVVTNYAPGDTDGSLPLRGLQALYEDRAGRLWIGGTNGLCSFKDGVFSPAIRHVSKGIPNLNVWAMHEDREGNLWLGTHFGLIKFRDRVLAGYTTEDGLPHETIRAIHEDRHGAFWLGTEGGLVKFQDGRFTAFTIKDGLVNNRVWSIYEDAEGVLWLGTFDGGLSRFKDGRFTNYTMAQGLYNNGVFQILEDGRGNLWISCFRGLYSVSKWQLNDFAEGKIRAITSMAYGKADGMLSSDCNGGRQPSGVKTSDGRLWFTTLKGVAVLNPNSVAINSLPPPVRIEEVEIDNIVADGSQEICVQPGQANLEIRYTALSFLKPEQIRFRYKLIGQGDEWIEAGARRTVNYSYLPPGNYTFQVLAANSDGVWNNEGAQLRVVVLPAFYQTWWFRLLALLAIAGVIGLVFKQRLDQAHRARQAQEDFSRRLINSQEQERKRIAAELHDGLGQNLLIIKNHALLGLAERADPAATEENLTTISEMTSQVLDEARQIAYNLRPYQIDRFGLTKAIQAMLNRVADASEIAFHCQVDELDGIFPQEAEMNLYRIVQESVNNILKHSRATEAEIKITRDEHQVLLRIADNGQGIADCGLRIADSGGREPSSPIDPQSAIPNPQSGGFGLIGIAERARMLGGQYQLQSTPGQGTAINISITLPETAPEDVKN